MTSIRPYRTFRNLEWVSEFRGLGQVLMSSWMDSAMPMSLRTSMTSQPVLSRWRMLSECLRAETMTLTFLGNLSGSQKAMLAYLPVSWSVKRSTASITITTLW